MQILFPTWQAIVSATQTQPQWHERLLKWYHHRLETTLHLVILREPYLSRILTGQKRIESRFACDRRPPFARVNLGDILLLKRAGGPLVGLALVKHVISRALTPDVLDEIRYNYAADLAIDDDHFWERQTQKRFVTLVWIGEVCPLPPIPIPHRDRRGWILIRQYVRRL
ncbi:ASCH domain-containing protein [Chloroflexus sp. Y-396-1]|uniref:ASCH domain-containing protein n=1 Tax=Chloroflexus sp. Y-396-1 TaxID=867845 RepID=UPI00048FA7FE|nr:ASCH domain-containing protein [Chloroflexus sp. Y-396-1]